MTIPIERTRALRMAWEFMWELKSAGNLVSAQPSHIELNAASVDSN